MFSQSYASAACQLVDTGSKVVLNKLGVAPSFATYAGGETLTATVKTKENFSCEGYQVQFMFCPVNGSSADCSLRNSGKDKLVTVQNGSASATWNAAQFNNFTSYRIKAAAGTDNPNAGSSWQYYSDRFDILSSNACGVTNFTALRSSGNKINLDITANTSCEGKAVGVELLIQSSNLGTSSGGTVASGKITSGKFSATWPIDPSLGTVYFKACVTGGTCQTSTISGIPPGGNCGNGVVDPGEQCDKGGANGDCPAVCSTSCATNSCGGGTQTYSFNITNPLKGGADDFSELVKIIAQWIFNLAIPIAVAMIVYAGILFLISAGDTSKVTKARQVLTYAVVGLAIILIGSGFVTLIQSILELGGTGQTQGPSGPALGPGSGPISGVGAIGNKCSRDRDCNQTANLKCKNTICQRPTGNLVGEPCNGGASCDIGLACDQTSGSQQVIDGQTLGTCFETSAGEGRIGNVCQKDNDCISGLKCNQICQRKGGNLNDEACLKTSNPSNCKSTACSTIGTAVEGVCVDKP